MMISIPIEVEIAEMMFHNVNSANETIYIVRRPNVSEKDDHQSGKILMEIMYIATDRLVIVGVVFKSSAISGRAAG